MPIHIELDGRLGRVDQPPGFGPEGQSLNTLQSSPTCTGQKAVFRIFKRFAFLHALPLE